MATSTLGRTPDPVFEWEGRDRQARPVRGEMRAASAQQVEVWLRRQGITGARVRTQRIARGGKVKARDIAVFTRQLATMMKAGVPLLQAFEIVGRDTSRPAISRLLQELRADVETGTSLAAAFRKFPRHFSPLYCSLIEAGEAAGVLDTILERLAVYLEKFEAIKSKVRAALMYPLVVLLVALIVVTVIMVVVVPAFKDVFASFGAQLPAPTRMVISLSEFLVAYGLWLLLGGIVASVLLVRTWRRSPAWHRRADRWLLKLPILGPLVYKSVVARWTRTLATLFAAGVPLVEALDSVGGAAGNAVFAEATTRIGQEVSAGTSLTAAMAHGQLFPPMVLQMAMIGEEAGALDHLLLKAAEFYDNEVDDAVAGLSTLLEPVIIVFLGVVIGGIVVAMYLPIFQMGQIA